MRIGIVNDLPLAVEALRRAIALKRGYEVAWVAGDGAAAVEQCARDTPDLVLMDLVMPGIDGVEATRRIMAATPCAILVVTVNVGANAWRVFEAMGQGALDAVDTPTLGGGDLRREAAPLLDKIEAISRLIGDRAAGEAAAPQRAAAPRHGSRLLAIGASAGGPAALSKLLSVLPRDFDAAVVVVQHVDEQFAQGMADWLNLHSGLPVTVAREGDRPEPGKALLAGTSDHLAFIGAGRLGYTPIPREYVYRPSVDVFFDSICRYWPGEAVGVLLTGMGRDGALGLKALRDKGCRTIAQDKASSAVYGMPKAAMELDAAQEILALDRIGPRLLEIFGAGPR